MRGHLTAGMLEPSVAGSGRIIVRAGVEVACAPCRAKACGVVARPGVHLTVVETDEDEAMALAAGLSRLS